MLERDTLLNLLSYDPTTGNFTWRMRRGNKSEGSVAGCLHENGRVLIGVEGKLYWVHRLVWLYVYGHFPQYEIDHINRKADDNRLINLRPTTRKENQENQGLRCNNKSGHRGVSWDNRRKKWIVTIRTFGKTRYVGAYISLDDAAQASLQARDKTFTRHTD